MPESLRPADDPELPPPAGFLESFGAKEPYAFPAACGCRQQLPGFEPKPPFGNPFPDYLALCKPHSKLEDRSLQIAVIMGKLGNNNLFVRLGSTIKTTSYLAVYY